MNLIVVESPTKAKTLTRFLRSDFTVLPTMGHIKDLPKSKLGVDVEKNFRPDYEVDKSKSKAVKSIKQAAKDAVAVYIATDPDREGEAIAAHVVELLDNKPKTLKRIVFHEITPQALAASLKSPRGIDRALVDAQIARRVLDRLVGYRVSPLLWRKVRRGLSAGRVQTVTVRLIVEREREIEAFQKKEYWEIFCDLKKEGKEGFRVKLAKVDGRKEEVTDEKRALGIKTDLEKASFSVQKVVERQVKSHARPPFTTSTMTQAAALIFLWSARKTMAVAQNLYEEGLITYHRTDSVNISKVAIKGVRAFIEDNFGAAYLPQTPNYYKAKSKLVQEAHEAIRPTEVRKRAVGEKLKFGKDAKVLYDLIWKKFVASQMTPVVSDQTKILVEARHENKNYTLAAVGSVIKFDGWRKVAGFSKGEENLLPALTEGEALSLVKALAEQKFTQPPARFNDASLIKTLESLGIGRPSTYAPIISTILLRQYVERVDNRFLPTPVGLAVNDFLVGNFDDTFDFRFTAEMEDRLDKIASGKTDWEKVIANFYRPFEKRLNQVSEKSKRVKIATESLDRKCPQCPREDRKGEKQGELVVRIGRFGKFVSCSNFPDCDYTEKFVEKIGMKCPECQKGDVIVKKTKRGKRFFGCSRFPDCKFASWQKPKLTN